MPNQSYIICCTPRSGSHFLADILTSTGVAGCPAEHFPRFSSNIAPRTAAQRDALVTEPPPESSYDQKLDAAYVRRVMEKGMTPNGVIGINLHWFQLNDAVRRIHLYLGSQEPNPHQTLSAAFPNLSYLWLRRRDKIAQAISWYKAIETGDYIKLRGSDHLSKAGKETLKFDFEKIRLYWSALRSFDSSWEHYFKSNGLNPFVVYYEDVCDNYLRSANNILDFLHLNCPGIRVGLPRHEKAANEQSLQWIKLFQTMQQKATKGRGY